MATRYWVEVSGDLNGNWNSGTSHWSATSGGSGGASTPTSTDDVIFDQPGTYTVNQVTAFNLYGINCRDLTVETGTISFTLSGGYNLPLNLYGSLYVPGDAVWTMPIVFSATSSKTIDMACTTSAYVKFYGVGGIWVLLGDLTTTGTAELYQGTLNLGGYYLTCNKFESNNAQVRSIIFGYANIIINVVDTNSGISMHQINNFTYTGEGGFYITELIDSPAITINGYSPTYSNAPNLKFTTGASVPTITSLWVSNLDFGTTSFDYGVGNASVSGLTLSSSGTYTALTATMVGTGTITSNGKTIAALTVNSAGTATLAAALTMSGALTLTQGTLACGVYNVQSNTFASTGVATRSMTGSGTYTVAGSGATAFSNASAAGITITGLIISMTNASAKTFAGGGGTYPTLNQGGAGALTISGDNSFADLTATTRPSTITFTISTTQTFTAFTLSGTAGNLVTINSSTASTQATVSKSSGTVSVDYVSIIDSNAAGGASWYAGANSTNVSNNTGWIFTAPPAAPVTGNFFLFF